MATSSLPRVSKKAYVLKGKGPQVLLFHGYTGSPYDLKPIALFLNQHGYEVHVPLLHGHGTKARDLENSTSDLWHAQAREALAKLDATRPILLGGLSMGACLALAHARDSAAIKALLLFSPALNLKISAELLIVSARLGLISKKLLIPKIGGNSDIADPKAREKCPSYNSMSVAGLLEFDNVRLVARKTMKKIQLPIFLAFGNNDSVINTAECHNFITSNSKSYIYNKFYPRSQHVITLDYDRELLQKDLWEFLNTHVELNNDTHSPLNFIS
jgi:carboxylesterase